MVIKAIFTLTAIIGILNATEVAICQFKNGYSGFAEDKMVCTGAFQEITTMKDMYALGWKFQGSYRTNMYEDGGTSKGTRVIKEYTYIVMEK
ncbi:MAG: hypothetical protein RBR23_06075 [Arcobacteraceae bacterium]|jgi:hypothetical protein|nr:hypothetical protein [Arcobacteraceae bacterium]